MKIRKPTLILICVGLAFALLYILFRAGFAEDPNAYRIAVVGPVTGSYEAVGKSYINAVRLCVNAVNKRGGIRGRKITMNALDDRNDPVQAGQMALDLSKDDQTVAVIGHFNADCSKIAGEVYKKTGIPAISPGTTDTDLARNNAWYFSNVFNDQSQARFLASYAKKIFKEDRVSIIYENSPYGIFLANYFEEATNELGLNVKYKWEFDKDDTNSELRLREIIYQLRARDDAGTVFMAMNAESGVRIVKLMKDVVVRNRVIAPLSFASKAFVDGFSKFPKEMRKPGHYTDGIYVITPMLFETSNEMSQRFRKLYVETYGEEPDWSAAFAFDSALTVVEALGSSGVSGNETMAEIRRTVRDRLAEMTKADRAVTGVTGLNYFTETGDSARSISIGIYKNNTIISALNQLHPVPDIYDVADFREAVTDGRILLFQGAYMFRTKVVYTGLRLNKIRELDPKAMTCRLDFDIWFRYEGDLDMEKIEFLNAAEPVVLGKPVAEKIKDGLVSKRYHVEGVFRNDSMSTGDAFGDHVIAVKIRHGEFRRDNLIFVTDILGMGISDQDAYVLSMKRLGVLSPDSGWHIDSAYFFNDIFTRSMMGNVDYLDASPKDEEYSRFNLRIRLKKSRFTLRGIIPVEYAIDLSILSSAMIILLKLFVFRKKKRYTKSVWFYEILFAFLLLLTLEILLVEWFTPRIEFHKMRLLVTCFDILWWIVPAYYLKLALEPFVLRPTEERTNRPIPAVLRRFLKYIIYFLAIYGIVVYVFDQDITKLMATSGAIAMIIGFIIKANISNFFSGIVINQGDAINIGDFVKVGANAGKVVDITYRSTKLQQGDGCVISIPNADVSESVVYNYNSPGANFGVSFMLHVDPAHSPERIKKLLYDAVMSADCVLEDPGPKIRFKGFGEWSAQYSVDFSIDEFGKKGACGEAVWERIWKHLNLAGIKPVLKDREIHFAGLSDPEEKDPEPSVILKQIDIFRPFPEDAKSRLSRVMRPRNYGPGKTIVTQGESGDSLFIIAEGVVSVRIAIGDDAPKEIVRMGAGSFFGEMALLTGEPRNATIVSITETRLFEMTKEDILPVLSMQPEIFERLGDIVADRRIVEEPAKTQIETGEIDRCTLTRQILEKIRAFFDD